MPDANEQQRRYKEFLDLMPLTLELAGLPKSDHGKYYTEEQIEGRMLTIKHAYKMARRAARLRAWASARAWAVSLRPALSRSMLATNS